MFSRLILFVNGAFKPGQYLLGSAFAFLHLVEGKMAGNLMTCTMHPDRRHLLVASTLDRDGTAVEERATHRRNFNASSDSGSRFTGLHRIFQPTDTHFRHRRDQQAGIGMERG